MGFFGDVTAELIVLVVLSFLWVVAVPYAFNVNGSSYYGSGRVSFYLLVTIRLQELTSSLLIRSTKDTKDNL